jgi:broad specificity phosphatase PhoE
MSKRIPVLIILFLPVLICAAAWYLWYSPVTTVVLVRHAERLNSSDTTSISEAGIQRAQRLAQVVRSVGISRIYVSDRVRTLQTAQPTASLLNISPVQIPAKAIMSYVDSIKSHRGEKILIVGHSDTVPMIMSKLGIAPTPVIASTEFDNLFVLSVFRFRSTLVQLRY